ncbi:MAG: Veg family protein [Clostridia bacterium]|jgi:uncharacterized protein Veg|nr:Veg family protein [Clostridia bacterium]
MIVQKDISRLRDHIDGFVGAKVKVKANKGRRRVDENVGILEKAYPNVFVVKVKDDESAMERKLSYSYADLITRNVELTVHKKI